MTALRLVFVPVANNELSMQVHASANLPWQTLMETAARTVVEKSAKNANS
jgi:hypothetical protein